jgi:CheY-like chemotaxis protein
VNFLLKLAPGTDTVKRSHAFLIWRPEFDKKCFSTRLSAGIMKKGSLLIVEDDQTERTLIYDAFERIGIKENIYAVDDGEEAIAFMKRKGEYSDPEKFVFPTILLTDLKMPKINGFELLLFLKRSQFTIIPTIVFTTSSDPDDIKNAFLLGANAYHVKPVAMEGLCQQLKKIYEYWIDVSLPDIDAHGRLLPTDSRGKLSETLRHPVMF